MQNETTRVLLGLPDHTVERLDELCKVNDRSRPKLVAILIEQAAAAYTADNAVRVNPGRIWNKEAPE
jgi:predicted transcriptional regulator